MRALFVAPIVVVLVAVIGIGLCKVLGVEPGNRQMVIAGVIVLAASVLAAVPLILVRGSAQYAVSQAGLVGTVLHLMTAIGAGGLVYLKSQPGPQFLYWLAAMYWTSLIAVVVASVHAVKAAPPDKPLTATHGTPATPVQKN